MEFLLKDSDSNPFTPAEELDITTKYFENKDVKLRNIIATHNIRLVFKIVNAYPYSPDLVSEGCVGLIKGIEKYNPGRGVKLSTYVSYWIRAYILNFIVNDARLSKVGTTEAQRKLFFNLRKEKAKLEAQGIEVTPEMLAGRLAVSEKDVNEMEIRMSQDTSLNETVHGDEDLSVSKIDLVTSDGVTPDEALACAEKEELTKKHFKIFRDSLINYEKVVFEHRILGDETLQEVGERLNVSRERVRQLETRVIEHFARYAKAKQLAEII